MRLNFTAGFVVAFALLSLISFSCDFAAAQTNATNITGNATTNVTLTDTTTTTSNDTMTTTTTTNETATTTSTTSDSTTTTTTENVTSTTTSSTTDAGTTTTSSDTTSTTLAGPPPPSSSTTTSALSTTTTTEASTTTTTTTTQEPSTTTTTTSDAAVSTTEPTTTEAPTSTTTEATSSSTTSGSSTSTSTAAVVTNATGTTTIIPTWATTSGAPSMGALEVVLYFKPVVNPPDKTLDVTKELMSFREILTTRFEVDLAYFMNLPIGSFKLTTFRGHADGSFSTKVTFNLVYNTTAYIDRLKHYESDTSATPEQQFPKFTESVRGAAVIGSTVSGAMLIKVDAVIEDNYDALCFISQDQCQASYIVIVVGVVAVCAAGFFALRALFRSWEKTAPVSRDRQFNQEGGAQREDLGRFADAPTHDVQEMSLMQQYEQQEMARAAMSPRSAHRPIPDDL